MVSIMATILVLSSSGKEFNSCGSIFFFQSRLMIDVLVVEQGVVSKMKRSEKKEVRVRQKRCTHSFFFRTLVFFLHAREKKYRSRRRLRTHVSTSLDGRSSTTSSSLSSSRPPVDVGFGGDGVHGVAFFGRYFLLFLSLGLSFFFLSFSLSLRVFSFSFNNKTIDWSRKPLFLSLLFQKGRTRTRTESHTWRACR